LEASQQFFYSVGLLAPGMVEAWTPCVLLVSLEYPVYQLSEWLQLWQKHGHPVFYWFRLNTLYISFLNGSSYGRSMDTLCFIGFA